MTEMVETFDPSRYLRKVNGADYLEVKWRVLWLRTAHPDATIVTEMVSHEGQMAVFKAEVTVPGSGSATGWGSEQFGDFRDYIEKAETKALGRALAALGFGTQFCADFEFTGATNKVVDAPIDLRSRREVEATVSGNSEERITDNQFKYLNSMARNLGLNQEQINAESIDAYGRDIMMLSRREASQFIERLQQRQAERPSKVSA